MLEEEEQLEALPWWDYSDGHFFRALFQPEFGQLRYFLGMHDLALWKIFNLSRLSAVLVLLVLQKLNRRKPGRNQPRAFTT